MHLLEHIDLFIIRTYHLPLIKVKKIIPDEAYSQVHSLIQKTKGFLSEIELFQEENLLSYLSQEKNHLA